MTNEHGQGRPTCPKCASLSERVAALEQEVYILRLWGNKDCTAQADEQLELARKTTRQACDHADRKDTGCRSCDAVAKITAPTAQGVQCSDCGNRYPADFIEKHRKFHCEKPGQALYAESQTELQQTQLNRYEQPYHKQAHQLLRAIMTRVASDAEIALVAGMLKGFALQAPTDNEDRISDSDYERVISTLARMREAMIKAHPEWLGGSVSDVLECALMLEKFQAELLATTRPDQKDTK